MAVRLSRRNETVHAPHLLDIEAVQALRRFSRSGTIPLARADQAARDLQSFPVRRYPHAPLLDRVWELRDNLCAYDAVYVALAETPGAPLVTFDAAVAGAPGHSATVELMAPP